MKTTDADRIAAAERILAGTNKTPIPLMCNAFKALELRLIRAKKGVEQEAVLSEMRAHGAVCNCRRVNPVELSNNWIWEGEE